MGTMSEAERGARWKADRAKSRQAVEALISSEGWQRWLSCRRHFHRYSLANQLLIATQCPEATMVAGFRVWQTLRATMPWPAGQSAYAVIPGFAEATKELFAPPAIGGSQA